MERLAKMSLKIKPFYRFLSIIWKMTNGFFWKEKEHFRYELGFL